MKVKNLITKLLDFDQDAEILIDINGDEKVDIDLSWYAPAEGMEKKDSTTVFLEPKGFGMEEQPTPNDSNSTFMDLYRNGLIKENDIDVYIDEWHNGLSKKELYSFLGLTQKEWGVYLRDGGLPE